MRPYLRRTVLCSTFASVVWAGATPAQAPDGARFLDAHAVAESLKVLRALQDSVRKHHDNAAAWYHQGMIAFALFDRCRVEPKPGNLDCTRPRLLADSAFMLASKLEPENKEYILALGRFLLAGDVTFFRDGTYFRRLFGTALAAAKLTGDSITYANAALDMGRYFWLEYDAKAHRFYESSSGGNVRALAASLTADSVKGAVAASGNAQPSRTPPASRATTSLARNALNAATAAQSDGFGGEIEYLLAEMLFKEAFDAAPGYVRAYRAYATLVTERNRWGELAALARGRLLRDRNDGWAWMTLALARYRAGDIPYATAAFDTALRVLPDSERSRLVAVHRIFSRAQRASYHAQSDSARARTERLYWLTADPLWANGDDQPRVEFLARVAYAELVWTLDELKQRGTDSDRGEVYIRMGPPDRITSKRGENTTGMADVSDREGTTGAPPSTDSLGGGRIVLPAGMTPACYRLMRDYGATYFEYDKSGLSFKFPRIPLPMCRQFAGDSIVHSNMPARWDNLVPGRIDSIPTQFARFRAVGDSTDIVLASLQPVTAVAKSTDVAGLVRTDFWVVDGNANVVVRDSIRPGRQGIATLTSRLAPGDYLYRTETSAMGAVVSARASAGFVAGDDPRTGFVTAGFGTSDVLLATRVEERRGPARRWNDLYVEPLVGILARGATLSVVWENYEFGDDGGSARYGLTITLRRERPDTATVPNIAARIIGGAGRDARIERRDELDRVTFTFDRIVPHANVMLDNVALSLGSTPPGWYLLTLTVTDRVTGRSAGRSQRLYVGGVPGPVPNTR